MLDPGLPGRRELTDAIRAVLFTDSRLGGEELVASVLKPRGLTKPQA